MLQGHAIPGGAAGPNSEFLQDRCTDHLETYTIGKGVKCGARQCHKIS
jgi:hypothetical protein